MREKEREPKEGRISLSLSSSFTVVAVAVVQDRLFSKSWCAAKRRRRLLSGAWDGFFLFFCDTYQLGFFLRGGSIATKLKAQKRDR